MPSVLVDLKANAALHFDAAVSVDGQTAVFSRSHENTKGLKKDSAKL